MIRETIDDLSFLVGRSVDRNELSFDPWNEPHQIFRLTQKSAKRTSLPFQEFKNTKAMLILLSDLRESSVWLAARHSRECGAILVKTLADIRLSFDPSELKSEMLGIVTTDFLRRLTLEFDFDEECVIADRFDL